MTSTETMAAGPPVHDGLPLHRKIGLLLGIAALVAIALVPSGLHRIEGYGARPAYAAGVAALMAIWWFTEALPIHLTALAPLFLYPALGIYGGSFAGNVGHVLLPYVDPYIFLFLGGMAIGAAMEQWSLHRRIALHIMHAVGTEPRRLLVGMLLATASVSMWISNTATAVMMLPIALALLRQLESAVGRRLNQFGCALMLAVAWAANVGGIGSKVGTAANSIFVGFVTKRIGEEIGFLTYMAMALPFVLLMLPLIWLVLWWLGRRDGLSGAQAREALQHELATMGPMDRDERKVALVFASAALLWVAGDPMRKLLAPHVSTWFGFQLRASHYEAGVAMTAFAVLVLMRSLSLQGIRRIPFSTLLLFGGGFALASGIEGSGLSKWMANSLAVITELPDLGQVGLAAGSTVLFSALASNTATINVTLNLLPNSVPVLFASTLGSSCDFALPAGTPPNAIVFASGYVRLPTMMKLGLLLDLSAIVLITLYVSLFVGPVFGFG